MLNFLYKAALAGIACFFIVFEAGAQQKLLSLKDAEQLALTNYGTIKAKANQLNSSRELLKDAKADALPDVNVSLQEDYGTLNGQNALLTGQPLTNQNSNAVFGTQYVSNLNWNLFSFGKVKERVKVQNAVISLNESDLAQEQFKHQVRVASTYLNLLVAQQLSKAQQDNLNRAIQLQGVVAARVNNGLNPGVDLSLANAQVSGAKIALTNSQQTVQEQSNQLAQYLGIMPQDFLLDSSFVTKAPPTPYAPVQANTANHPELLYYRNRVGISDEQAKYLKTFNYPTFSLIGLYQGRASDGNPTRHNYMVGAAIAWNLTNLVSNHYQVQAQKYTSAQYQNEYEVADQQLRNQQLLAETRIGNALKNFNEAPIQVKAATDAYNQKYALYKNGLSNIVDFTQALYVLNRAEIDRDIASNSVWQALLSKAAATGDMGVFMNNF